MAQEQSSKKREKYDASQMTGSTVELRKERLSVIEEMKGKYWTPSSRTPLKRILVQDIQEGSGDHTEQIIFEEIVLDENGDVISSEEKTVSLNDFYFKYVSLGKKPKEDENFTMSQTTKNKIEPQTQEKSLGQEPNHFQEYRKKFFENVGGDEGEVNGNSDEQEKKKLLEQKRQQLETKKSNLAESIAQDEESLQKKIEERDSVEGKLGRGSGLKITFDRGSGEEGDTKFEINREINALKEDIEAGKTEMNAIEEELEEIEEKIILAGEIYKEITDENSQENNKDAFQNDENEDDETDENETVETNTLEGINARIAQLVKRRMELLREGGREANDTEVMALMEEEEMLQDKRKRLEEEGEEVDVLKKLTEELEEARSEYASHMYGKKGKEAKKRYDEVLRRYNTEVGSRFGEVMEEQEFEQLVGANYIGEQLKIRDERAEVLANKWEKFGPIHTNFKKILDGYKKLSFSKKLALGATVGVAGVAGATAGSVAITTGAVAAGITMRVLGGASLMSGLKSLLESNANKIYAGAELERVKTSREDFRELNAMQRADGILKLLEKSASDVADRAKKTSFS